MNEFPRRTVLASLGIVLNIKFSDKRAASSKSGLTCERGLPGMLEMKDFENIDEVSPFLRANLDAYSASSNARATRTFTLYVDIARNFLRKGMLIEWTSVEVEDLRKNTLNTQNGRMEIISTFQASGTAIQK